MAGRSKSFDQLLLDHRAAKEAALKAKQEAVAAAASRSQPNLLGAVPTISQSPTASPAAVTPVSASSAVSPAAHSHLHTPAAAAPSFRPLHST